MIKFPRLFGRAGKFFRNPVAKVGVKYTSIGIIVPFRNPSVLPDSPYNRFPGQIAMVCALKSPGTIDESTDYIHWGRPEQATRYLLDARLFFLQPRGIFSVFYTRSINGICKTNSDDIYDIMKNFLFSCLKKYLSQSGSSFWFDVYSCEIEYDHEFLRHDMGKPFLLILTYGKSIVGLRGRP